MIHPVADLVAQLTDAYKQKSLVYYSVGDAPDWAKLLGATVVGTADKKAISPSVGVIMIGRPTEDVLQSFLQKKPAFILLFAPNTARQVALGVPEDNPEPRKALRAAQFRAYLFGDMNSNFSVASQTYFSIKPVIELRLATDDALQKMHKVNDLISTDQAWADVFCDTQITLYAAKPTVEPILVYYKTSLHRSNNLQISTAIRKKNSKLLVTKQLLQHDDRSHLDSMERTNAALHGVNDSELRFSGITHKSDSSLTFEFLDGTSLKQLFKQALRAKDTKLFTSLFKRYVSFVSELRADMAQQDTQLQLLDLNFDNIIVGDDNTFGLIDYEWTTQSTVAEPVILARALHYFFLSQQDMIHDTYESQGAWRISHNVLVPKILYDAVKLYVEPTTMKELLAFENGFQNTVDPNGTHTNPDSLIASVQFESIPQSQLASQRIDALTASHTEIEQQLVQKEQDYARAFQELEQVTQSKRWKIASRLVKLASFGRKGH